MTSLHGVALVTGGGAGLGRACALALGQRGARVAVHYLKSRDGAEAVVAALNAAGADAQSFQGDLTKSADVPSLVAAVTASSAPIDILVNNTGDLIERTPILEMSDELSRGDGRQPHQRVPHVQDRRSGIERQARDHRRHMSSLAAWNGGGPGAGAYAAAKGAIVSLTKALAKELAPHGIRVNCDRAGPDRRTAFHGRFTRPAAFETPRRRAPRAARARRTKWPPSSPSSPRRQSFLTGETIEINGGMYMR